MDSIPAMLLGLYLLIATTNAAATGGSWSELFEGRSYVLSAKTTLTDVSDIQQHCADVDGYLAEIDTQAEYDFIMEFLSQSAPGGRQTALVGATDRTTEGQWVYMMSGAPVTFFSWYSNYGTRGVGRDCMYLVWNSRDAGMHDWKCQDTKLRRYVCEVPQEYTWHSDKATYDKAWHTCQKEGRVLAMTKNLEEVNRLVSWVSATDSRAWREPTWVGMKKNPYGVWKWADTDQVAYFRWRNDEHFQEPDSGADCATLRPFWAWDWDDVPCDLEHHFVCQKIN